MDKPARETWQVTLDGRLTTIATTPTSIKAMDEAMTVFAGALRRLAARSDCNPYLHPREEDHS